MSDIIESGTDFKLVIRTLLYRTLKNIVIYKCTKKSVMVTSSLLWRGLRLYNLDKLPKFITKL